jgi:hypothetical protein
LHFAKGTPHLLQMGPPLRGPQPPPQNFFGGPFGSPYIPRWPVILPDLHAKVVLRAAIHWSKMVVAFSHGASILGRGRPSTRGWQYHWRSAAVCRLFRVLSVDNGIGIIRIIGVGRITSLAEMRSERRILPPNNRAQEKRCQSEMVSSSEARRLFSRCLGHHYGM